VRLHTTAGGQVPFLGEWNSIKSEAFINVPALCSPGMEGHYLHAPAFASGMGRGSPPPAIIPRSRLKKSRRIVIIQGLTTR
jgi:hypothetical protein